MNNKLLCVISAPVDTYSGYGARSRDFINSLIQCRGEEWDIKILSQKWGNCPFGATKTHVAGQDILTRIVDPTQVNRQPDVWIQITVPNEMQQVGKFNVLVTASVETDIASAEVIAGANKADLVITSSEHGKKALFNGSWDQHDSNTKQKIGVVKIQKPVEVLFEGVDTSIFDKNATTQFDLSAIPEKFAFLSVAHFLQGAETLEDRKNLGITIKTFLETFKNKGNAPCLLLKTSVAGYSVMEEEDLLNKIDFIRKTVKGDKLPNIYVIHGALTDLQMCGLYKHEKVKAFVLPSNEGFGRPFLEFSAATSKPVITCHYSGQADFLEKEFIVGVGGAFQPVPKSLAGTYFVKESNLFRVDHVQLSSAMKDVFADHSRYSSLGKRQGYRSRTEFSLEKMTAKLDELLTKHTPVIAKPVTITLPKLNHSLSFTPKT